MDDVYKWKWNNWQKVGNIVAKGEIVGFQQFIIWDYFSIIESITNEKLLKHCGKMRAISSFFKMFSNVVRYISVRKRLYVGKGTLNNPQN